MGASLGQHRVDRVSPSLGCVRMQEVSCEPGSCCAQQLQVLFHALAPAPALGAQQAPWWGWAQLPLYCSVICFFYYQFSKSTWGGTVGKTVIICLSGSVLCTLRRNSEISADTGLFPFVWVSFDSFQGASFLPAPSGVLLQETSVCPDRKVKGEQVWRGKEAKQAL